MNFNFYILIYSGQNLYVCCTSLDWILLFPSTSSSTVNFLWWTIDMHIIYILTYKCKICDPVSPSADFWLHWEFCGQTQLPKWISKAKLAHISVRCRLDLGPLTFEKATMDINVHIFFSLVHVHPTCSTWLENSPNWFFTLPILLILMKDQVKYKGDLAKSPQFSNLFTFE